MFGSKLWIWAVLAVSLPTLAAKAPRDLGHGFNLAVDESTNHLSVTRDGRTIWETVPGQPFLSASAAIDQVVGSSGNFNITQIDKSKCTGQQIAQVTQRASDQGAVVRGILSGCGDETARFSLSLWVPAELPDRVAFHIDVNPGSSSSNAATKLFFTYASSSSEDFYGLGGQASFASLKNQSVPIFSREQGVGRGDEPTTRLENEDSYFAGGDQFTTYSATPQYITSESRVFHLSQESTAYANFDFRNPRAVTVRYAALEVDGYFMQGSSMLDGISMLTEYTGRMPELPRWVDTGAVLGIQGGQEKVNRIVDRGLQQDCPIAAVWLQDW
jgi:hypothetical protein